MNTLKRQWCAFLLIALSFTSFSDFNLEAQSHSMFQIEWTIRNAIIYKPLVGDYKNEDWKQSKINTVKEVGVLDKLVPLEHYKHNYSQTNDDVSNCKSANVGKLSTVSYKENPHDSLLLNVFNLLDKGSFFATANSAIEKTLNDSKIVIGLAAPIQQFLNEGLSVAE